MAILAIYTVEPTFPATAQNPTASRTTIGNPTLWVDYTGSVPVQADVDAILSPSNGALSTKDLAELNAALAAPGSVVRGLALVVLDLAKGVIPINPAYTTNQLVAAIQARMR